MYVCSSSDIHQLNLNFEIVDLSLIWRHRFSKDVFCHHAPQSRYFWFHLHHIWYILVKDEKIL